MSGRVVWFIRHGHRLDQYSPEWETFAKARYNPDLSPVGILQAMKVARRMLREPEPVHHLIASPFLRTLRTASFLSHELKLSMRVETGVGEMRSKDMFPEGDAPPPPVHELREQFPMIDMAYESQVTPVWPEAETNMESGTFGPRIAAAMKALLERFEGNFIVVGHYASCNGGVASLTGAPVDAYIENCTICKVVQGDDGKWTLVLKAESTHLFEPLTV